MEKIIYQPGITAEVHTRFIGTDGAIRPERCPLVAVFHIISKDCSLKLNKSIRNLLLESADTLFGPSGCLPRGSHSYRCDGDWNCNITGSCPLNQNPSERGLKHLTVSLSIHPRHAQIRDEIAVRLLEILDELKWKEKEPADAAKKYVYCEN